MEGLGGLPQHLQLKVLSMLDDGAFDKAVQSTGPSTGPSRGPDLPPDTTYMRRTDCRFSAKRAVDDIKARGFAVFDYVMGVDEAMAARNGVEGVASSGLMRRARMGKDSTQWADSRARGDEMVWFTDLLAVHDEQASVEECGTRGGSGAAGVGAGADSAPGPASFIKNVAIAVEQLKTVGMEVSNAIGGQFECQRMTFQLARYADGARYVRHSDVGPQTPDRRLTCIFYLNPDWKREDGGELRLHLPASRSQAGARSFQSHLKPCDVAPLMNRLVMFRSEV